jgi:hypothetical protein
MRDAPLGAQAGFPTDHFGHQFVGVQAAFHQRRGLAEANQFDGTKSGGMAVRHVFDLHAGEVEPMLLGKRPQPGQRSDQDRLDQTLASGLQCGA